MKIIIDGGRHQQYATLEFETTDMDLVHVRLTKYKGKVAVPSEVDECAVATFEILDIKNVVRAL